jgi:hypothetical protein
MKFMKLFSSAMVAFLLVGAPQAMAVKPDRSVDTGLVVGVDSASGEVSVESDLCMQAVLELVSEQNFDLRSASPLGVNGGPELTAYLFTKSIPLNTDVATLFCIARNKFGGL